MLSRFIPDASRYGFLFLEVALTVFGVLLGLAANEWRKAEAEEAKTQVALQTIRQELQNNLEEVDAEIPYHRRMRDSLMAARERLSTGAESSYQMLTQAMPEGFTVAELQDNAWELANRTGALQNVDYALAAKLANVYGVQAGYASMTRSVGENFYVAENVRDPGTMIFALGNLSNDVLNREQRLRELYAEAIERLQDRAR
jgi:hypothetical protein